MSATPSSFVRDQGVIDREHVRLLAIFHFVAAGMAFVGLLFLVGHYSIMNLFLSEPDIWEKSKQAPPPAVFMVMFRAFYMFFGAWFVLSGVLNVLSGIFMRRFQHRVFSLVVAGFNCLHIPLGTVLGIFTLIVLSRDSVARSYADAAPR
jgi:hypothetical protein